ncbi:fasciclin domain-containing protein [Lyngbya aestuarii]|uniref:fasciclin domain-containing protein n=1 Tax=Lyngbya aestuarii TaxID=118322 RepID=UPI00403E15FC
MFSFLQNHFNSLKPVAVVLGLAAVNIVVSLPASAELKPESSTTMPANTETQMVESESNPMAEPESPESMSESGPDIVAVALNNGSFTILTELLETAGLVETLQGEGPFTVFAPTDEAFAALPEGTLEELMKEENKDALVEILTYHVVPGSVMSTDLVEGEVDTVEGNPVMIKLGDAVMVNDATVVTPDVEASNGVIHVIDKVILPPIN